MKKLLHFGLCAMLSCVCVLGCFGCSGENSADALKIAELERQIQLLQKNQNAENSAAIEALQQQIAGLEEKCAADVLKIAELERKIQELQVSSANENNKFFMRQANEFAYTDFDYSMANGNDSYQIGTEENEQLFFKILSGEYDYRDYLDWFAQNPDYMIRFNAEALNCIESIIREGKFTEDLRAKYFGLYISSATTPYFASAGMSAVDYQIYFNEDWTVWEIWQTELTQEIELKQLSYCFEPILSDGGGLKKYYLSFSNAVIEVDMDDGKTVDCGVDTTYYRTLKTEEGFWNGETQDRETVTYLSRCRILVDYNNVYSGGTSMFDEILIFTEEVGIWDLANAWQAFKAQAMTPSSHGTEFSGTKLRFLKYSE